MKRTRQLTNLLHIGGWRGLIFPTFSYITIGLSFGVCSGNPELTKISLENGMQVNCADCPKLTEIFLLKATAVYSSNCPKVENLSLPNVEEVRIDGCSSLTHLNAPKAQRVIASVERAALTEVNVPEDCEWIVV